MSTPTTITERHEPTIIGTVSSSGSKSGSSVVVLGVCVVVVVFSESPSSDSTRTIQLMSRIKGVFETRSLIGRPSDSTNQRPNFQNTCSLVHDLSPRLRVNQVRIRAYNTSLLIKPPLQPNLNKPPLFCLKSPLFKAFWGKNPKNFNKPPPKNPQIFINRRRTIGADTVINFLLESIQDV